MGGAGFHYFLDTDFTDLHRLDVANITQFIYFNSHGDTPHTTTEYNSPNHNEKTVSSPPPATTHPSIHPHFTPNACRNNRKAPASPPSPQGQAVHTKRGTLMSEPKGGAGKVHARFLLGYRKITSETQRAQRLSNKWQRTQNELERTPGNKVLHLIYIFKAMAALHRQQLNITTHPTIQILAPNACR